MRYDSSALIRWTAVRSSHGKTATVRAPSSYAARKARTAISPRLATRILANTRGSAPAGGGDGGDLPDDLGDELEVVRLRDLRRVDDRLVDAPLGEAPELLHHLVDGLGVAGAVLADPEGAERRLLDVGVVAALG